jgi:1-acyl-sn-glycerol-3-phosphate acyltransferase
MASLPVQTGHAQAPFGLRTTEQSASRLAMLNFLPAPVVGTIAAVLLAVNALVWVPVLLFVSVLKLLLPIPVVQRGLARVALWIAEAWIACNSGWMALTQRTAWDVEGLEGLDYHSWYLVSCNHQSWVDILVLQHLLNRRIPLLKFFIKRQLIWVPVMGLAWWALEFPFMRRHSEEYLRLHPEMRGKDQETTRQACERFALIPTSVMNFVEGTRFTPAKHARQGSPYRHLLKPKAGGMAMALNAMGSKFQSVLDVTIVYPAGAPTFWHFLCGRLRRVIVRVQPLPVPRDLAEGDYAGDPAVREAFQRWVQQMWRDKDAAIDRLLAAEAGGGSH